MLNPSAPDTHSTKAFVYIVESPAADDLFDGRTEGRLLCEALRLAGIRAWYRVAASVATFDRCLGSELIAAMNQYQAAPILHLSAHGNDQGLALTDGSFFTWHQLRARLVPVNQALSGALILCMSSCFGAAGCRMAMHEKEPLPFYAMVGHYGSPTWSDAAVAFVAFYHRLFKGAGVDTAIAAMMQASGDDGFLIQHGQQIQQSWAQYVQKQQQVQEMIDALALRAVMNEPNPGTAPTGAETTTS